MIDYVMFGTHPLFGDYVDAIHARGGRLARVIINVEEPPRRAGERFADRLDRYHAWLDRQGESHRVDVVPLAGFGPRPDDTHFFGFRGTKLEPLRALLESRFGLAFPPIVHPSASVSPMAAIAEGAFIGAGAVVAPNARIGSFALVNRGATIGHDSLVGSCVVIGPSAALASGVSLARGAIVGIGATILENVRVGDDSYVAAGAVVRDDVPDGVLVAGVPAVIKKSLRRA